MRNTNMDFIHKHYTAIPCIHEHKKPLMFIGNRWTRFIELTPCDYRDLSLSTFTTVCPHCGCSVGINVKLKFNPLGRFDLDVAS